MLSFDFDSSFYNVQDLSRESKNNFKLILTKAVKASQKIQTNS